jgi:magnesium-transporting ATPase (P-type)
MNQGKYKTKISKLERTINKFLFINLGLMLTMAFCLCLANYSFNNANMDKHYYIFEKSEFSQARLAFNAFFSFYLILNAYVPLDLIIVIEIAKLFSTPFMEADAEMKHVINVPISAT